MTVEHDLCSIPNSFRHSDYVINVKSMSICEERRSVYIYSPMIFRIPRWRIPNHEIRRVISEIMNNTSGIVKSSSVLRFTTVYRTLSSDSATSDDGPIIIR